MPPTTPSSSVIRKIEAAVASTNRYSIEAVYFLQEGLERAVDRVHGPYSLRMAGKSRHITGQQLCEGLREIAVERWGLMAPAVLGVWGVTCTRDFGKIVFALIDAGLYQKTPTDSIDDFDDVYDFRRAFGSDYRIRFPETIG